ncbi:MAG: copper homeostasis protein CutC [Lachnospiraceae bacterium]|nr:copper homeostasis protein CutC [Lachnospiraceae bacterium]MDY5742856.1 copper homeostasis protein CutC [Lachnospiraceae bacterium]
MVEICCGSFYDVLQAAKGGATRVELNSALFLGGLTPSPATVELSKTETDISIISMLRPRAGGFCYLEEDFRVMVEDAKRLLEYGSDGLAFGCLTADGRIDLERTKLIVDLIKSQGKEAVVHRAFDCVPDAAEAVEALLSIGVDRILTSGQGKDVMSGLDRLAALQADYGERMEFLAGCGVRSSNVEEILSRTGISQVHSSCKAWRTDPTTMAGEITYAFAPQPHLSDYDVVSADEVRRMVNLVEGR